MSEARRLTALVQEAVESGANTAEEVHKSVMNLPLDIAERIHLLEGPVKELRRVQNESIGAIYDLVRSVNQRVGTFATELLEETESA